MSKYRKIKVEFRSEKALKQAIEDACEKFGIEYEYHQDGAPLLGYKGDTRAETAQYIIRRGYVGRAANDLGFARKPDGTFEVIVSEFDAGLGSYSEKEENEKYSFIKQRYAYHQVIAQAQAQGYHVTEQWNDDGSVELALERAW